MLIGALALCHIHIIRVHTHSHSHTHREYLVTFVLFPLGRLAAAAALPRQRAPVACNIARGARSQLGTRKHGARKQKGVTTESAETVVRLCLPEVCEPNSACVCD